MSKNSVGLFFYLVDGKRIREAGAFIPELVLNLDLDLIAGRFLDRKVSYSRKLGLQRLLKPLGNLLETVTGKTTLLSILCSHQEIGKDGILLLAPTGKARVKMEQVGKQYGAKLRG